jgi:hypothetical protein
MKGRKITMSSHPTNPLRESLDQPPYAPPHHSAAATSFAVLDTIDSAAAKLCVAPTALRSRCRRAARQVGDMVVAKLGGGIIAFKFGASWRIRFPHD